MERVETSAIRNEVTGLSAATTQMVAKVAAALASQSSLGGVTATIVNSLHEMGAAAAHVLLVEPGSGRLVLAAQKGVPMELVEQISVVARDAPMVAARAAQSGQLQIVGDAAHLDPSLTLTHAFLRGTGGRSLVAAPLIAFGALVGVLSWTQLNPMRLSDEEVATIKSIAEVFAVGIVNANNVSALRQSNQRFEEIIDTTPIGMSLVSLDGRFVRPNRALCELVGYTAQELQKLRFQDITHPADLDTDLELANKLLRGEIPRYTLPKRYIRKDGSVLQVVLHGSIVRDGERPLYFIAQIQDVTEAKQREEALARSEARFRLLAENAHDLVYRMRLGEHPAFEYVSPSAFRITGYTPEEHYADPNLGFRIVHPADRGKLQAIIENPAAAVKPIVLRFLKKGGETIWVEQLNTPVYDESGALVAIEGFARDITDRKQAEEALIESEERLRFIVEHSPDAIYIQDRDLRYVWVANTFPGYKPEEFLGKTEFDMVPIRDAARTAILKRQVMATGNEAASVVESSYQGRKLYLDVRYAPWRDREGNIIGVAGFVRDISESKRTEEALRENEERLRMAQSVARMGSWDWDLATGEVRWSPEIYRLFGMPEGTKATYESYLAMLPPEDAALVDARVREALSGGARYEVDHKIVRPDGTVRIVHEEAELIGEPGAPQRMIGTTQDVTERSSLESEREKLLEAIAAEKQWIEKIVERSPIGILLIGSDGSIKANARAEQLFGQALTTRDGAVRPLPQLFHADCQVVPPGEWPSVRVMRGESLEAAEFMVKRPDGSVVYLLGSATPIFDADGSVIGGVAIYEDITAIRQLERMREEWIGVVAHDLRQPLTAMAAQAELLKYTLGGQNRSAGASVDHCLAAIRRMSEMTQELLDATVIESKRVALKGERRNLRELTAEVLDRIAKPGAEVLFARQEEPVIAYVDPQRYEQIVLNLLNNAAKYGASGRPVEVRIEQRGMHAVVSVINEGEGIQPEEIASIFERYQRTPRGKAKAPGLGLGLYIVRGLVEAHGGRVWVESTPGETTTFSFALPVAAVH